MPIEKIYEIGCDECGEAYHGYWTIVEAEKQYVKLGGIIKRSKKVKKYYCDDNCYQKALKKQEIKK